MKPKPYSQKIKNLILEERLLLPDFQRDFVWKTQEQQLKLVCSLFLDIPIGSILVLDKLDNIGLRKLCYKKEEKKDLPQEYKLLMDGQQRISTIKSIFSDLYNNVNWDETNEYLYKDLRYRWFLNLSLKKDDKQKLKLLYDFYWNKKFEDYDIEDIESIIVNKKVFKKNKEERWHPSQEINKIKNYCTEEHLLPLFLLLSDSPNLTPIIKEISENYVDFLIKEKQNEDEFVIEHCKEIEENFSLTINEEKKSEIINKIDTNIREFFNDHIIYKEIYGVEYEQSQLNKAIVAFNTMNTGGISLGVFDIVSAKYSKLNKGRLSENLLKYVEKIKIDEDIKELIEEKFVKDDKNLITKSFSDMYLNMLSLFIKEHEKKEEEKFNLDWIKQKSLLKISAKEIKDNSEKVVESLILAFSFLIKNCGVPSIKDIRYKLSILPIAYNLYKTQSKEGIEDKIEYSYWMSVFSGKYEKGQNAFSINHLNELVKFINNSNDNKFKDYEKDLCNKKGYSDFHGFSAFYEENDYNYSKNIGEYFLQFILASSVKYKKDTFRVREIKKIEIKHFGKLNKDHIIPSSLFKDKKLEAKDSVLNLFYSPEEVNKKRSADSIKQEIQEEAMESILCCPKNLDYDKKHYENNENTLKDFLEKRFKLFAKNVKKHLESLEKQWKD